MTDFSPFALIRVRLDLEKHAGPHIAPTDVRGCRGCEAIHALDRIETLLRDCLDYIEHMEQHWGGGIAGSVDLKRRIRDSFRDAP